MYKIIIISTLIFSSIGANAQSKWGAVARFGDERGVFTFTNPTENVYHKNKINPMMEFGVSRKHYEGKRGGYWFQDVVVGFSNQLYDEKSFSIGTKTGYQWALWNKILLSSTLGVAYNRAKPSDLQYAYEDGKWVQTTNYIPALNRLNASAAFGIGYRITPKLEVNANYQYAMITNYIPQFDINLNVLKSTHLTARYWF